MYNDQIQKFRRVELRKNQTEAEKILWGKVRNKQLGGVKFYRQYGVGPYILDIFSPASRLAIELDGEQHKEKIEYDQEREMFLKDHDIYTLRFWNDEIIKNLESVLEKITEFQRSRISPLS